MEGKVVFNGITEKGLSVTIRYVQAGDEEAMHQYINTLSKEQTFISFQGEEISIDFEKEYIKNVLEKFKKKEAVHLLAFTEGKLVGISDLHMRDQSRGALKHEGVFGVSVLKEYRGMRLGTLLMRLVLHEAQNNLLGLRIITLGVFSTNDIAKEIYKKFGFTEYGRLPEGVFRKGKYEDHIYMYKKVK